MVTRRVGYGAAPPCSRVLRDRYVDSVRLVESWSALRRRRPGRPISLLLEVGFMDGRTGARNLTEAIAVAEAVHAAPDLRLAGIAGFEGIIRGDAQMSAVDRVRLFLDFMVETARECERLPVAPPTTTWWPKFSGGRGCARHPPSSCGRDAI